MSICNSEEIHETTYSWWDKKLKVPIKYTREIQLTKYALRPRLVKQELVNLSSDIRCCIDIDSEGFSNGWYDVVVNPLLPEWVFKMYLSHTHEQRSRR